MGSDKVRLRLREIEVLECPLCMEQIEQCDECGDSPVINEDWYCYSIVDNEKTKKSKSR